MGNDDDARIARMVWDTHAWPYRLILGSTAALAAIYELVLTNYGYRPDICALVSLMAMLGAALMWRSPFAGATALLSMELFAAIVRAPLSIAVVLLVAFAGVEAVRAHPQLGIPLVVTACAAGSGFGHTVCVGMPQASVPWSYAACAACAVGVGLLLRARQRQEALADEVRVHNEQRRLARLLHDHVANDINDIVMLAERRLEDAPDVQVERMRSTAQQALDSVRQVIVALEGSVPDKGCQRKGMSNSGGTDFGMACDRARDYHARLEAAGFPVSCWCSGIAHLRWRMVRCSLTCCMSWPGTSQNTQHVTSHIAWYCPAPSLKWGWD